MTSTAMPEPGTEKEQPVRQPGLSFRGGFGRNGPEGFEVGASYRHHGTLATCRDPRVATDNFADGDVVAVFGREGVDLAGGAEPAADLETDFGPDPVFTVIARVRLDPRPDSSLGDNLGDRFGDRGPQPPDERLEDEPWLTVIVVRSEFGDIEPNVDEAVQRASRAVLAARSLPVAEIAGAGRFRGPIGVGADGRPDQVETPEWR